jgi:hypothetical protein
MYLDWETSILLAVIGVMLLNQLVMRVGALKSRSLFFWSLQLLNLATGTAVITFGLPGFERWKVVNWIIGLLFFFRTVQNNNTRARWLREQQESERRVEKRRQLEAALQSEEETED